MAEFAWDALISACVHGGLQKFDLSSEGRALYVKQFREICAQVHYKAALRDATHFYVISETPETISVNQIKITPFSNELTEDGEMVVFKDWSQKVYSHILGDFIGIDPSELDEETTDRVSTFLKDDEGNFSGLSI